MLCNFLKTFLYGLLNNLANFHVGNSVQLKIYANHEIDAKWHLYKVGNKCLAKAESIDDSMKDH